VTVLLEVEGLCVNYGHIEAIRDISFSVEEGAIETLIGANGAGKTTTLKTISGLHKVRAGSIRFDGREITGVPPYDRVKMGITQAPEGRGVFPGMTVRENLEMGAFVRTDRKSQAYADDLARVFDLFPRLSERTSQPAGKLSGGEQQMLAIGRGLMGRPTLLLLDEPSMGLAPRLVAALFEVIVSLRAGGVTMLLVEQNAHAALSIADRGYVLETGRITLEGPGRVLLGAEAVRAAYLGIQKESA
jgi:branched-chain amino acid transport system ATP-binding protein